jgi:hypothetical protein
VPSPTRPPVMPHFDRAGADAANIGRGGRMAALMDGSGGDVRAADARAPATRVHVIPVSMFNSFDSQLSAPADTIKGV